MPDNNAQFSIRNAPFRTGSITAYWVLVIVYCALLSACAQIVNPDGGAKDVTPPHVVDYAPDSAATNFKGNKIVIRFDEYIALNDLNKQLIISPAVRRKPEITVRKRDLVIEFKDTLQPNTTYSISFGKAIRDITESNALNNFRYVFSTGDMIDSLKISGTVVNALSLRGEKNAIVMLYRNTGDSVPYKEKPYYYTRTDDNGNFMLTNLAPAKYKIFALIDQGEDYLYNSKEEMIAFSDSLISLTTDIDSVRLFMFREKPTRQVLVRAQQTAPRVFSFVYNLPVTDPKVTFLRPLPAGTTPYVEFSEQGDTTNVWFDTLERDSVFFVFSDGAVPFDTVAMKVEKADKKTGKGEARTFQITNNLRGGKLLPGAQLMFTANNPIAAFDSSKILFIRGRDTLHRGYNLSRTMRHFSLYHRHEEDSTYRLFIPAGAITDIFGNKNDSIALSYSVSPPRTFGNLTVKIPVLQPGNHILQLLDDKDNVVRDTIIHGPANCYFSLLSAGNYRVRLILDANNDQRWTSGNYLAKKQPERVIYHNSAIRVRAGWDMDVEWKLTLQ